MKRGILTKLEHRADNKHGPEDQAAFKSGEVQHVVFSNGPEIGHRFEAWSMEREFCSLSPTVEILDNTENSTTFKTQNSIYKLEVAGEVNLNFDETDDPSTDPDIA